MRMVNDDISKTIKIKSLIPLEIRKEVAEMRWKSRLTDKEIVAIVNKKYNLTKQRRVRLYFVRVICIEFYGEYMGATPRKTLVSDRKPIGDNTEYTLLKYRCHPDVYNMLVEARIPHSDFINTVMRYYKTNVFDKEKERQNKEFTKDLPKYFE